MASKPKHYSVRVQFKNGDIEFYTTKGPSKEQARADIEAYFGAEQLAEVVGMSIKEIFASDGVFYVGQARK